MEIKNIHRISPAGEPGVFDVVLDFIGLGGELYERAEYRLDVNDPNGLAPSLADLVALLESYDVEFDEPLPVIVRAEPVKILTRAQFELALVYGVNVFDTSEWIQRLASFIESPQERAATLIRWRSIGMNDAVPRDFPLFGEKLLNQINMSVETFDALWAVGLKNA